ncbi:MAG: hypothetical protein LQ349_005546 [Xanthoria aureola]|nr:MAG: hypothetical protein LQ349_005546 [Xanthoria aureola]
MATQTPRLMGRNGVIEPASATQPRSNMPRLKLVVRRLPPGSTQEEFELSLGDEWKVGCGRVDWAVYKPGKVSKDPSKPSRPSRAYLNLTKQEYIGSLADAVRNTKFNDATVEYAPFPKTPHLKVRRDNRQGTIDQDPEFIEFLESLTNPVPKVSTVDQRVGSDGKTKEKVTVTPLIQFLKDKKANKGKEAAGAASNAKAAKHVKQSTKETQSTASAASDKASPAKTTTAPPDKRSAQAIMVERAARDAARVVNKQTASPNKPQASTAAPTTPVAPPTTAANSPLAEKKRERGSASAAASILRRDLGIGATPGSRGGRRGLAAGQTRPSTNSPAQATPTTPAQQKDAKVTDSTTTGEPPDTSTSAAPVTSTPSPSTPQPPTGPAASRASAKVNTTPSAPPTTSNAPTAPSKHNPTPPITPTATQAFLKHANPSQGITEPLLSEAFAAFGTVKSVEIDRKKGSAYVDFEEPEGLQKAIKASPIKVAQGQVVVLERRMGPNVQGRSVRGGGGPGMSNRGRMPNHRGRGGLTPHTRGGVPTGPMAGRGGI